MKISILTPSFNAAKYLPRAIESVMAQDYRNWEHIIIDGGSSDASVEILKRYDHLVWISEKDKGQSDAMNKAFMKSSGDVIIYLNADDAFEPGWFSEVVQNFQQAPEVDMVVGRLKVDREANVMIQTPSASLVRILDYWPCKFPLNPVSYAYRRWIQERIGQFPNDNHYTMDYWFLLRAYKLAKIKMTNVVSGTFFFDKNNKSADAERAKKALREVRDEFISQNMTHPRVLAYLLKSSALYLPKKIKRTLLTRRVW